MRILFLISVFLFACRSSHLSKKELLELQNNPPGTVWLKDNLYIDKTEVPNVGWREFLFYQQRSYGSESKEFEYALPDTLVWTDIENGSELSSIYFRHPGFNNSPVIGISYEQAKLFCEWRTNAVNTLLSQKSNNKFRKVKYRLPSIEEWEQAAADGLDLNLYPYGLKLLHNKKKRTALQMLSAAEIHFL